ncbi:MAG: hypothetical protein LBG48_04775 [Rickettsiales bacterium]|jgi:hypothetical protein|nr:hypothetical protein [Rickettsiales bacterium]
MKNFKNIVYILLLLGIFTLDFVFFDYEISDIIRTKMGHTKIIDKYAEENDNLFPLYILSDKSEIKNCVQLSRIRKEDTVLNVFSSNDFRIAEKNCKIISILKKARNTKKGFINKVELVDFDRWNGDMVFEYACKQKNDLARGEDYRKLSLHELKNNKIIDYYITNSKKEIIIKDLLNGRMLRAREIARGNFDDNEYMEILLEITIADKYNNFIECYKLGNFSRESSKKLMHKTD